MGLRATWSGGRGLCSRQGVGARWSFRSLPTQTILWLLRFYELRKYYELPLCLTLFVSFSTSLDREPSDHAALIVLLGLCKCCSPWWMNERVSLCVHGYLWAGSVLPSQCAASTNSWPFLPASALLIQSQANALNLILQLSFSLSFLFLLNRTLTAAKQKEVLNHKKCNKSAAGFANFSLASNEPVYIFFT